MFPQLYSPGAEQELARLYIISRFLVARVAPLRVTYLHLTAQALAIEDFCHDDSKPSMSLGRFHMR